MKNKTILFTLIFIGFFSLNFFKNKEILSLNKIIKLQILEINNLEKKEKIRNKLEKHKKLEDIKIVNKLKKEINNLKNIKISKNNILKKEKIVEKKYIKKDTKTGFLPKEKKLEIAFYSQFPLDISTWIKYDEPYQNFCEEASLLNWYYYLIWEKPDLKKYKTDLLKLRKIEDLIFKWWYKDTSIQQTLELLVAFQDEQKVFWKIIKNPTINLIKKSINKWYPVLIPAYWKGLSNYLFSWGWPIYHNLLIKWYTEKNFITNEVWVSKWDWFMYKQEELMEAIHNYDPKLYPNNFTKWKKEILILYKK